MIRNFHGDHNFMVPLLRDLDLRMSENSGRGNSANGRNTSRKISIV